LFAVHGSEPAVETPGQRRRNGYDPAGGQAGSLGGLGAGGTVIPDAGLISPVTEADEPARVLVVDDEMDLADAYASRLADSYDVSAVYSGEDAVRELGNGYDVMLLDRRMPGLSGAEVLEERQDRGLAVRVVVVTAIDPEFDIPDVPYDDYLVKPVTGEDLHRAVERALALARYNQRLQDLNSLRLERNVLEVETEDGDPEESGKYRRLTAEMDRLRAELADLEREIERDFDLEDVELYL
jgi:two-component system response regulator AdeR